MGNTYKWIHTDDVLVKQSVDGSTQGQPVLLGVLLVTGSGAGRLIRDIVVCTLADPFASRLQRPDVGCFEAPPFVYIRAAVYDAGDDATAVASTYSVAERAMAASCNGVRDDSVDERLRRD